MNSSQKTSPLTPPPVAWIGDDFTGAAAVMEVLTFSGIPSVLFLGAPTQGELAAQKGAEAFGIATLARSRTPEWMARNLPQLYRLLAETGAELVHYKICSTLDSSPTTGSIGKAIEEALTLFKNSTIPVVVAAPQLKRYQAFGNLFCGMGTQVYRLDRHPVMSRHPVTPMHESDVALHLSKQTNLPTRCLELEVLCDQEKSIEFLNNTNGPNVCSIDMMSSKHEVLVGSLLWNGRQQNRFIVGSQGIEYALVAYFKKTGRLKSVSPPKGLGPTSRMAVVSGSVSPITADQISWARKNGFATIKLEAPYFSDSESEKTRITKTTLEAAEAALSQHQIPLIYSAEGPDDPFIAEVHGAYQNASNANDAIGKSLGRLLHELIREFGLTRVVVSGGDTSGHVCAELGIYALEAVAPTIPGAAICRAKARSEIDGLEIALKGGQMGSHDYFGWVRDGGGERR